jgi:hypothetical protein
MERQGFPELASVKFLVEAHYYSGSRFFGNFRELCPSLRFVPEFLLDNYGSFRQS